MRLTALMAGLDEKVPALTLDMQCASAAAAIVMGYAKIRSGLSDLIICGGWNRPAFSLFDSMPPRILAIMKKASWWPSFPRIR